MPELPVVDEQGRKRIRTALKRYQDEHGKIGVPELQQRMIYVLDGTDRQYLDLSSLQRFMRGKGRTTDEKVRRYRKFLERVAPPTGEDVLGQALAGYAAPLLFIKDWDKSLAGAYRCTGAQHSDENEQQVETVLRLERVPGALYLRAAEGPLSSQAESDKDDDAPPETGRRGVLFAFSDTEFLLLLRSYFHTQLYLLTKVADAPVRLTGVSYLPGGAAGVPPSQIGTGWQAEPDITMVQMTPEESA